MPLPAVGLDLQTTWTCTAPQAHHGHGEHKPFIQTCLLDNIRLSCVQHVNACLTTLVQQKIEKKMYFQPTTIGVIQTVIFVLNFVNEMLFFFSKHAPDWMTGIASKESQSQKEVKRKHFSVPVHCFQRCCTYLGAFDPTVTPWPSAASFTL